MASTFVSRFLIGENAGACRLLGHAGDARPCDRYLMKGVGIGNALQWFKGLAVLHNDTARLCALTHLHWLCACL